MQTAILPLPARSRSPLSRLNWSRGVVVTITLIAIFLPLFLIFYQSFLNAPFFMPVREFGFDSYRFIFDDPDFAMAFKNGLMLAFGLTVIAVPLGGMLAFLMVRTDLPRRTPCSAACRISRSTVQRATARPSRCNWRQTLSAP